MFCLGTHGLPNRDIDASRYATSPDYAFVPRNLSVIEARR